MVRVMGLKVVILLEFVRMEESSKEELKVVGMSVLGLSLVAI